MIEPVIVCRGVWKIFGPDPARFLASHDGAPSAEALIQSGHISAVRDANLEVHPGEILVIMGLSGSGKSTLVRCLSRLIKPTAGQVLFQGVDFLKASDRDLIYCS